MQLPAFLSQLISEPDPEHLFEISEAGLAYARSATKQLSFHPFEAGVVAVSPLVDNVIKPEQITQAIHNATGSLAGRKRSRAVLILPDYSARVAQLEFETFPADPKDQLPLVRFRMKKSVPFDVESAAISYYAQPALAGSKRVHVIVVVAALEIVGRYEAPFRAAGLHPGIVTTSVIAMSSLCQQPGVTVAARLSGRVLTVAVYHQGQLKLVRCVELQDRSNDEVLAVLFPTLAFAEDDIGSPPDRVLMCGFGHDLDLWRRELDIPVEPIHSAFGVPSPYNAGLLGYLQSTSSRTGATAA